MQDDNSTLELQLSPKITSETTTSSLPSTTSTSAESTSSAKPRSGRRRRVKEQPEPAPTESGYTTAPDTATVIEIDPKTGGGYEVLEEGEIVDAGKVALSQETDGLKRNKGKGPQFMVHEEKTNVDIPAFEYAERKKRKSAKQEMIRQMELSSDRMAQVLDVCMTLRKEVDVLNEYSREDLQRVQKVEDKVVRHYEHNGKLEDDLKEWNTALEEKIIQLQRDMEELRLSHDIQESEYDDEFGAVRLRLDVLERVGAPMRDREAVGLLEKGFGWTALGATLGIVAMQQF